MIEYQEKAFVRPSMSAWATLPFGNPNILVSTPSTVIITMITRFESGRISRPMSKGAKDLAPKPGLGVRVAYPSSITRTGIIDRACAQKSQSDKAKMATKAAKVEPHSVFTSGENRNESGLPEARDSDPKYLSTTSRNGVNAGYLLLAWDRRSGEWAAHEESNKSTLCLEHT